LLKLRLKKHLEIRVVAAIIDDALFLQSLKKNIDFGGVIFKNALCYNSEGDSSKPPFIVFDGSERREVPVRLIHRIGANI
jgi:hypothetical protein